MYWGMDALNGTQKAVILLLNLGVEAAIEVTKKMDRSVAYDLMRHCANMAEVDPGDSELVLEDFIDKLRKAGSPTGREFVGEVMKHAFGGDDPLTS